MGEVSSMIRAGPGTDDYGATMETVSMHDMLTIMKGAIKELIGFEGDSYKVEIIYFIDVDIL